MQEFAKVDKRQNYRTPGVSPGIFKLSKRLRSCSRDNVSDGAEVAIGGGTAAEGGADEECCFAATEAGTKDIMETAGFLAEAGAPATPARLGLAFGPLVAFFAG
jgi:hypothetical protein